MFAVAYKMTENVNPITSRSQVSVGNSSNKSITFRKSNQMTSYSRHHHGKDNERVHGGDKHGKGVGYLSDRDKPVIYNPFQSTSIHYQRIDEVIIITQLSL